MEQDGNGNRGTDDLGGEDKTLKAVTIPPHGDDIFRRHFHIGRFAGPNHLFGVWIKGPDPIEVLHHRVMVEDQDERTDEEEYE